MNARQVTNLLVERNILRATQAEEVLEESTRNGRSIEQVLIDGGFLDEHALYQAVAEVLGSEFVDLSDREISPAILELIPSGLARLHRVLPVDLSEEKLQIALSDPLDLQIPDDLRFALGRDVQIIVSPIRQVEGLIQRYYGTETPDLDEVLDQLGQLGRAPIDDLSSVEAEANATPVIQFVDTILLQAIQSRASDIHFEPFEDCFRTRCRIDGTLCEMATPSPHLASPVISRVKVMANLNIAERRLPQDGRIRREIAGHAVDLRVSTLPTQFGESVVLRVLDRSAVNLDLESLGLPSSIHDFILEVIERPNGMFIVTGPTGSGKTTTLYSCLRKINTIDSKLLTVEEPVEYDLDGVIQVPVNEAIGLSFARALRAFLRQDPDRIMVGETRDLETARISIQAALTGHLVFTTLHTNDAAGTITRLIDMGVEPFLISSTVEAILAQRLLRTICTGCRIRYQPDHALLDQLAQSEDDSTARDFYRGKGCSRCSGTGYKGRKGIFELMKMTDSLRELIGERAPTVALKEHAIQLGMITLRQDALCALSAGETTVDEVLRHT